MPKLITFVTAKEGMSRDAFIEYYETNHVPLVRRLLPTVGEYRRSYVAPDLIPRAMAVDYDCVTELGFDDQAALDAFLTTIDEPEIRALIRADEANFIERSKTRTIGTEQRE
jgi:uncharacterized protein (TIGR02118 family)